MEVELAHNGKQPEEPTGGDNKDEKPTPAVGLGELFHFADGLDLILMAIGVVVSGCSLPVFLRFFADLVNSFGSNSSDLDTMVREVIKISCWMWTGERQTTKMRIRYLESALNQDVRYFDTEVCDLDLPAWFTNRFDDAVHDLVRVEHSGFLHVALSCWVLLSFGPQVCRGYGAFTFFLIYALGGISGNLTSFIHTPELTVCGTGPEFAIIGAWLVYQVQNKEVIPKEVSESMFWKAVIATVLSFVLSYFGRIDDWTHLGATLSGIIFGYLTCPTLELDDAGQREGIALVQRQTTPCKSLVTFTLAVLILSFLVFLLGCQEILQLDGLV